jgi:hypothetical protein
VLGNVARGLAILGLAFLFAPLIMMQLNQPKKAPVVLTSNVQQAISAAAESVAMRQVLVAESAVLESPAPPPAMTMTSQPSIPAQPAPVAAAVPVKSVAAAIPMKAKSLQPTGTQVHNASRVTVQALAKPQISVKSAEAKPTVSEKKYKQTHNLNLDTAEFRRIMLLPTRDEAHRVETAHKALEACYSCKPIAQHDRDHANIPDRLLLSDKYLPFLSTPLVKAVLNVAPRNIYDIQAEHFFRAKNPDVVYITIEPLAEGRMYGGGFYGHERSRHHQDYVENINKYPHPPFDVVVIHGVIGWGIDGEKGMKKLAVAMHKAMADGGLLYMWRNFDSPADASVPKDKRHGTVAVLDYLLPYFVRFNGTWHLNPGATVESEAVVDNHHMWTGRCDLLQRVTLGPDVVYPEL